MEDVSATRKVSSLRVSMVKWCELLQTHGDEGVMQTVKGELLTRLAEELGECIANQGQSPCCPLFCLASNHKSIVTRAVVGVSFESW